MKRRIKLMAEYGCSPLWVLEDGDLLSTPAPEDLPVSRALIEDICRWRDAFEATYDADDPRESGFGTKELWVAFDTEGQRLHRELKSELGDEWDIEYKSYVTGQRSTL